MYKVILLRHGESVWNKKGLFTGWVNVDLTSQGEKEARLAGKKIKSSGLKPDLVFENFLRRCTKTTRLALAEIGIKPKIIKDWRLNERHYGALQGLNKQAMVEKYGFDQVFAWRRSYQVRPPQVKPGSRYDQSGSPLYKGIPVPRSESLRDVEKRVGVFWRQQIIPAMKSNKLVLISASGNSLRALARYLGQATVDQVADLNIPTGIPLVYEFGHDFQLKNYYYLANKAELKAGADKVRSQIKAK